ncbi:EAL domain-containing protein [Massilia antarctica]|uniref:EAL domain-containing protein n=1 Tax=Massilia antarctica TaxID=2765360 RepID=A0AA49A6R2_9BURK|nr:EAL domain-containing protein [Massilia antarctica]QPI47795.1 EAL domain-containing protein [Massilia antarctica]
MLHVVARALTRSSHRDDAPCGRAADRQRRLQPGRDVRAGISLSHELGFRVVAEGIETDEVRQLLRDQGCDEGQGYLFARPLRRKTCSRGAPASQPARPPRALPGSLLARRRLRR